ncbi:MAG TPA: dienelactone hydrolase family protein, partial [Opitutales bacterium]|nr:dienelactone hydrolase family protein [Opitutales bacterium]
WVHEKIAYQLGGENFRGHLVYNQDAAMGRQNLPAIFMVPNWMGPDKPSTLKKAKEIAGDEFAVFVADMYGVDLRPANAKEAGEAAGFVRGDRGLMRARAAKGIEVFRATAQTHPINSDKMLGIGFCFGGGTLLEYARSGAENLKGIVSFHGDLASPTLDADADQVKIPLIVLHGADDPYVPQSDVQAFIGAMRDGEVDDWTLVQFSNTVHSFTDPSADSDGARYQPRSAKRAFEMMDDFAKEVLEP